jgi:hypothetical protein
MRKKKNATGCTHCQASLTKGERYYRIHIAPAVCPWINCFSPPIKKQKRGKIFKNWFS